MTPGENRRLNDWLEKRQEDATPDEASHEAEKSEAESSQEWEIQSAIDTLLQMQENQLALSADFHEKLSRRIEDAQDVSRANSELKLTAAGEI